MQSKELIYRFILDNEELYNELRDSNKSVKEWVEENRERIYNLMEKA